MRAATLLLIATPILFGCDAPVNESLISTSPAGAQQFAAAKNAAANCARNAPDWAAVEIALKRAGYSETSDDRLRAIQRDQKAVILEAPDTDVIVLVGSAGREGACIVGLKDMTPQQSYELALPWAKKYGALTNEERGQGLADDAIQAWGSLEDDRIVYIAAFKTWDVLDVPGAAARLLYIQR